MRFKPILTLDIPIYVGFLVLDLSKLLMYKFHYKYLVVKYRCGAYDNLVYETETDDVYENFHEHKSLLDFSDYRRDLQF